MIARICALCLCLAVTASTAAQEFRRLPLKVFRDKMKGAWIGQMAGVGWGAPPNSSSRGRSCPRTKCPLGIPT